MILEVPFVYTAQAVLGRKRNPDKVVLSGRVACEVREASADDAPVVLWWQGRRSLPQEGIRHFEGRLYAPVQQQESRSYAARTHGLSAPRDAGPARRWAPSGPAEPGEEDDDAEFGAPLGADADGDNPALPPGCLQLVETASFVAALAAGAARISGLSASTDNPGAPTHALSDDGMVSAIGSRENPQPLKGFKSSGHDAVAASISEGASRLLSVDGVLFAAVPRPVLVLRTWRSNLPELHRAFAGDPPDLSQHVFAVENYDRMRDLQKEVFARHNKGAEFVEGSYWMDGVSPPEIVRPDLLPPFDETENLVFQAARAVLSHLSHFENGRYGGSSDAGPRFATFGSRDLVLGFGRLRDAVEAKASVPELCEHMERLAKACSPHGTLSMVQEHAEIACARADAALSDEFALGSIR
jgi:hypothetical protein